MGKRHFCVHHKTFCFFKACAHDGFLYGSPECLPECGIDGGVRLADSGVNVRRGDVAGDIAADEHQRIGKPWRINRIDSCGSTFDKTAGLYEYGSGNGPGVVKHHLQRLGGDIADACGVQVYR